MTQFQSIRDALNYLPFCPLCKNSMNGLYSLYNTAADRINMALEMSNGYRDRYNVTFTLIDEPYKDVYTIDIDSNNITRNVTKDAEYSKVYDANHIYGKNHTGTPPQTKGHQYLSIGGICGACSNYTYMIQIVVWLTHLSVQNICLNSERLIFPQTDDVGTREIRNSYTTRETLFTYFPRISEPNSVVTEMSQKLPLLPIDRDDPNKTLDRIKNLLIFT